MKTGLQEEKDTCQKIVQRITKRLTNPDNSDRQLVHKYHLRGVATTKDVVYVCRRAEPDLIEMGDGEDDGSPRDQWWRLAYIESDPDPLKVQKVTLEEVLQMMWDETKTPMLVYATEEAINEAPIPLSGPLQVCPVPILIGQAENASKSC